MEIRFFEKENNLLIREMAELLAEAFPHCYGDCTAKDMKEYLEDERIALMAVEDGHLLGFVGAMPQYDYAWELHPLAVKKEYQHRGIGAMLVRALEKDVQSAECLLCILARMMSLKKQALAGRIYLKIPTRKFRI